MEHNRTCAIIYITSNQSSKQATLIDSHHNCDTYQLTFYPIFLSNCWMHLKYCEFVSTSGPNIDDDHYHLSSANWSTYWWWHIITTIQTTMLQLQLDKFSPTIWLVQLKMPFWVPFDCLNGTSLSNKVSIKKNNIVLTFTCCVMCMLHAELHSHGIFHYIIVY